MVIFQLLTIIKIHKVNSPSFAIIIIHYPHEHPSFTMVPGGPRGSQAVPGGPSRSQQVPGGPREQTLLGAFWFTSQEEAEAGPRSFKLSGAQPGVQQLTDHNGATQRELSLEA